MMYYRNTTQVPNFVLDKWLKILNRSEILILLIIVRQTIGWFNSYTGKRKEMDRISQSQFVLKTGLTARMVSKSLNSLLEKKLIAVYDKNHVELQTAIERKGKYILLYSLKPMKILTSEIIKSENNSKINSLKSVSDILKDDYAISFIDITKCDKVNECSMHQTMKN